MVEKHNVHEGEELVSDTEYTSDIDDVELEEEETILKDRIKSLREKLKVCEAEKQKNLEDLQRTRADFLNSKRRLEEQVTRDKERAKDKIIFELLTLADSFDIAMTDQELWNSLDIKWKSGVEAIHAKLISILKSNNVATLTPLGEAFNPEEHEAVSNSIVSDDADIDKIIAVLQKGYKRGDDIIRPARVVVGTK